MGHRLFVSAGDPSGDNAASHLIACLKQSHPDLECVGLGGPRLGKLGQRQLAEPSELAVLGFWEVARRYFFFRRLLQRAVDEITQLRPGCILLVDYPGFNLRLAERIKPLGIPIVYYISPQVWAWHASRIEQIKRLVDKMILILPFEQELYARHEVAHVFVGHYLLDDMPSDYISSSLPTQSRLALLPGSRPQEIDRMLPVMLATARRFHAATGTPSAVAALANGYDYTRSAQPGDERIISFVYDDPRSVISDSTVVLTASGTATLETGIIGRPMVVIYKTGWVTYQIARRLVTLDKIALVNLVLNEKVVPELIQHEANPAQIERELLRFGREDEYCRGVIDRLRRIPDILGGTGASQRAADEVDRYL